MRHSRADPISASISISILTALAESARLCLPLGAVENGTQSSRSFRRAEDRAARALEALSLDLSRRTDRRFGFEGAHQQSHCCGLPYHRADSQRSSEARLSEDGRAPANCCYREASSILKNGVASFRLLTEEIFFGHLVCACGSARLCNHVRRVS